MQPPAPPWRLVVIGDRKQDSWLDGPILGELLGQARPQGSPRVVLASIGEKRDEVWIEATREALNRLGVGDVRSLRLLSHGDAGRPWALGLAERSTLFLLEGDPVQIVRVLSGTPLGALLRRRLDDSLVVAGVGRGASALGEGMVLEGPAGGNRPVVVDGLGYLGGVIFDPSFADSGRLDPLEFALNERPDALGIGIDAATGLFVAQGACEVFGAGSVTVLGAFRKDLAPVVPGPQLLAQGDRFDLVSRATIEPRSGQDGID